jgi:hypothetical protein
MLIVDITFLCIILPLAMIFMVLTFIYKGIAWFPMLSGVFWVILGAFLINKYYTADELFAYQYYVGLICFGVAIAMFFAPLYTRQKSGDIEMDAPSDIDIWKANRKEHRTKINEMKNARRNRHGDQE